MPGFDLVIVGGGLASARAIKSFRKAGGEGSIALISKDSSLPYHRPPLSKKFLRGETDDEPLVEDEAFYTDHAVEVMLETEVSYVDVVEQSVRFESGEAQYGALLLASGAWPRRLQVPGADLDGIFTLRRVVDSRAIREAAEGSERAVVVGAGFIGMEVAASLRQLGKEVSLIHQGRWLFEQLGVEPLSDELASLYRANGVELVLGNEVAAFEGNGTLEEVATKNGRRVAADLAVVGIGVDPVVDFLEDTSGIELDNGIVVNERFETNAPYVYAAGDVANFYDPLFKRQRRIEHWSNANYQGTEVGKVLAGADGGYDTVSSFFTEIFGITIKVFGDARRDAHVVVQGSLSDGMYALYGDQNEEVIGALSVGQSEEIEELLKRQIAAHAPLGNGLVA